MAGNKSYLKFDKQETNRKTAIYIITSEGGQILGQVAWFVSWRRYCFYPYQFTLFDIACLNEIQEFIKRLMEDRKAARNK